MTSIVILNYNTPSLTINCIESIKENTPFGDYEIIVVDNASKDDSVELLKRIPKEYNVKLIVSEKNLGFAGGCNLGMRAANGEEICLLNSDTIVTPNWLKLLKNALYSDEKIGMAGPVTNSAARQKISVPILKNKQEIYDFAKYYAKETKPSYNNCFNLIFFCVLIKREVYTRIGGLDESFFPGNFEDDDYSIRARLAGFKLTVANNVFIYHYGSESFKKLDDKASHKNYEAIMSLGRERLIKKYGLTNYYKANWTEIIYQNKNLIKSDSPKLLLINTGAGLTPFELSEDYPKADISLVSDVFMDSLLMTPDFSSKYCPNIETDLWKHIDGDYDFIYLAWDIMTFNDWETFITKIFGYLIKGGAIMLYAGGELKTFRNE